MTAGSESRTRPLKYRYERDAAGLLLLGVDGKRVVGYVWAFAALTASPGARAHYDKRKTTGDRHTAAQRNLFNRLPGCLHHCLQTCQHYNEHIAFPTTHNNSTKEAA